MNSLEFSEYELKDYFVFRLTSSAFPKAEYSRETSYRKELEPLGFCILELKKGNLICSKCSRKGPVLQVWWHNKLPDSYIYFQEKFKLLLCLDCAKEANNQHIVKIKSNSKYNSQLSEEKQKSQSSQETYQLLELFELGNEQIEYYQIYRNKNLLNQKPWPFKHSDKVSIPLG